MYIEFCIDSVNVHQKPTGKIGSKKLVIIPLLRFSCNGRITSIRARVIEKSYSYTFPYFQVWRPSSTDLLLYNKTSEVQLSSANQVTENIMNIKLTGNNAIEFQSGDIIGYYHPHGSRYIAYINNTNGYKLYRFDKLLQNPEAVNISEATKIMKWKQPLLQFTVGMN